MDPEHATATLVDTLSTAMMAFHACARSAEERAADQRTEAVELNIVEPKDASDEAIRHAALGTASSLGLFAKTWPEFYAFGLAVKRLALSAPRGVSK